MTEVKQRGYAIGWLDALVFVGAGIVLVLVLGGALNVLAVVIVLILAYMVYMGRGMVRQARRFRPVEPPGVWRATLIANLALMVLGMASFGWYALGGGSTAWIPFLVFVAGMIALRQWRRSITADLYAWRVPALRLLQQGDYRKLIRELEDEALAGDGHPDKLAMVALAYVEQNKFDYADSLLEKALACAPHFASVNGALGSLRRHQARYEEAIEAIQQALAFEDNVSSRYYLGLCQYLAGHDEQARRTLQTVIDDPTLLRQGQLYSAYILAGLAEKHDDAEAVRRYQAQMAQLAPQTIPALQAEARRHKQTAYGETLKQHTREMERIIARRPLAESPD